MTWSRVVARGWQWGKPHVPAGPGHAFFASGREARGLDNFTPLVIDLVVVSHVDDDHIVGIIALFRELFEAAQAGIPPPFEVRGLWHNSFDNILGNVDTIRTDGWDFDVGWRLPEQAWGVLAFDWKTTWVTKYELVNEAGQPEPRPPRLPGRRPDRERQLRGPRDAAGGVAPPDAEDVGAGRQPGHLSDAAWFYFGAVLILAGVASALAAAVWRPGRRRP